MAVTARLKALTRKTLRVDAKGLLDSVEQMAERRKKWAEGILTTYPPPRPNSKYKRTGTLRRGWDIKVSSVTSGVNLRIRNDVRYVVAVHGSESGSGQWSLHAETGWMKFSLVLNFLRSQWNKDIRVLYAKHPILKWS